MRELYEQAREWVEADLARVIVPVVVLVVGFIVALILAAIVRRGLRRTKLDDRLVTKMVGKERAAGIDPAVMAGRVVYYTVLAITAVAFLQAIQLTAATEPLNRMLESLMAFIPNLIGAGAIALVAWMVALLVRASLSRAMSRWDLDGRVRREVSAPAAPESTVELAAERAEAEATAGEAPGEGDMAPGEPAPLRQAVAEAGFWLVWLMFTPALLDALALTGLLVPVQELLNKALGFLPNIASAALIVGVGWLVARVIQRLVTSVLAGAGTDRLSKRVGLDRALGKSPLSSLIGLIVYIVVLIPVGVAALNALALDAVTQPASSMLEQLFAALPAIFGAALLIGVAYVAARLLYGVVHRLLEGLGFDSVLDKIGFTQEQLGARTPSQLIAGLAMVAVMYFAAIEAAQMLEFATFAGLGGEFAVLAGHILLGLVIFGVGLFLSKLAADAVEQSNVSQARVLSVGTRVAILTLAGAMALRQMGIADEIIELAFGLVLGAVAVATALAFGLGGREAASKTIEELRDRIQSPATDGGGSRASGVAAGAGDGGAAMEATGQPGAGATTQPPAGATAQPPPAHP